MYASEGLESIGCRVGVPGLTGRPRRHNFKRAPMRVMNGLMPGCAAALAIFLTCGCASFKSNRLGQPGPLAPLPAGTPKPTLSCTFSATNQWSTSNHPPVQREMTYLRYEFTAALTNSGRFASISTQPGGEVTMDVMLHTEVERASHFVLSQLAGYFFNIVPVWATFDLDVVANVQAGNRAHTYRLNDAHTIVEWLPLLPLYPFFNPDPVPGEVRRNLYQVLLHRMEADGFVPGAAAPPAARSSVE